MFLSNMNLVLAMSRAKRNVNRRLYENFSDVSKREQELDISRADECIDSTNFTNGRKKSN